MSPGCIMASRPFMADLMSPTIGAAIGRLLSISSAEMSNWMNLQSGDHCGG